MANLLVVPIYLDALILNKPTAVVEKFADFSRLPYFDGERDINPDIPNVSEEILSQPFQNQNLYLDAGVHLHWSLPDALTRGRRTDGKIEFPAVPNRWLITRVRNGKTEAQWVVESDYISDIIKSYLFSIEAALGPGIANDLNNQIASDTLRQQFQQNKISLSSAAMVVTHAGAKWTINDTDQTYLLSKDNQKFNVYRISRPHGNATQNSIYPVKMDNQPFGYLGRSQSLDEWVAAKNDPQNKYLDKLTAVGYGEPAFAAFYPNCQSVFGFHDSSDEIDLNGLAYEVIGWYSDTLQYDSGLPFIASNWKFQLADVLNWEQLLSLLGKYGTDKTTPIGRIYNFLGSYTKSQISLSGQKLQSKDQDRLIVELNDILMLKELYQKATFQSLEIDDVIVKQLLEIDSSKWSAKEVMYINRRLIEAAFFNLVIPRKDWLRIARDEYKWNAALIQKSDFVKNYSAGIWEYLIQKKWLKKNDNDSAWVIDRTERNKKALDQYTEHIADISERLDFAVLSNQPERFICYAQIAFDKKTNDQPNQDSDIAIGNTSTEALSAYLANQLSLDKTINNIDDKFKHIIEEQLEALHLAPGLEKQRLDVGLKFQEARHTKGFRPVPAGLIWTLRPDDNSNGQQPDQAKANQEQVTLPLELAELLNDLNEKQQAYDRVCFEIDSLRGQLFADWYKYMLCAYPPLDTPDGYPDIDEVRQFIEQWGLAPLEQAVIAAGKLKTAVDAAVDELRKAKAMIAESDIQDWTGFLDKLRMADYLSVKDTIPVVGDLSDQGKAQALKALNNPRPFRTNILPDLPDNAKQLIEQLNKSTAVIDWLRLDRQLLESLFPEHIPHRSDYVLKNIPAPRYWEPNDPVVLLTGDAAQPSDRHGPEGELQEGGLLNCGVVSVKDIAFDSPKGLNDIRSTIGSQLGTLGQQKCDAQPWNPIMLEWEIGFSPARQDSLCDVDQKNLANDKYQLAESDPDFSNPSGVSSTAIENVYVGRSILTPHAKVQLQKKLQEYLVQYIKQSLWDAYKEEKKTELKDQLPEQFDPAWVVENLDAVLAWSKNSNKVLAQFMKDTDSSSVDLTKFMKWSQDRFDIKKYRLNNKGDNDDDLVRWYQTWLEKQTDMVSALEKDDPDFKKDHAGWLKQNLEKSISWYQAQVKDAFLATIFINAYEKLEGMNVLAQSLGGFNQALLMHKQTIQLPLDDPLGFDDYRGFTKQVNDAVGRVNSIAPQPLNTFNPIRAGQMKILKLRLIDTFGQWRDVGCSKVITSETMPLVGDAITLYPRLAQAARLNFRWLAAKTPSGEDDAEMNDHPATSPICGWILPNNLDDSLMIYEASGRALGSLDRNGAWHSAPGRYLPISILDIPNQHLRKLVHHLYEQSRQGNFFECFLNAIENALENIDPENFAQHEALALLMGRPIAVVRASLNLELRGRPAINQDWNVFRQDMQGTATQKDSQGIEHLVRTTDGFTGVSFPIRIGEFEQLNDGLIGYWKEKGDEYEGDTFYAPQALPDGDPTHEYIQLHEDGKPAMISQSIDNAPHKLTMLLDPRGVVHATCGILPTKSLRIPSDQFADALRAIEVTFLSAPFITDLGKINLPLPDEPGYEWSWLEKENGVWTDETAIGPANTQATFASKLMIREGWLKLRPRPDNKNS